MEGNHSSEPKGSPRESRTGAVGIKGRTWAVATVSDTAMRARKTKAVKNLKPGDVGLIYSNIDPAFTTPFVVRSEVSPETVITDIWPEGWVLPFEIEPLSDGNKNDSKDLAYEKWGLLKRIPWKNSISATLNFTGTTIFVPTQITEAEWNEIVLDLA